MNILNKIALTVKICCKNEKHANILQKILSIEDKFAPPTIKVKTFSQQNYVISVIEGREKVETVLSTLNDIFETIKLINSIYDIVEQPQ